MTYRGQRHFARLEFKRVNLPSPCQADNSSVSARSIRSINNLGYWKKEQSHDLIKIIPIYEFMI